MHFFFFFWKNIQLWHWSRDIDERSVITNRTFQMQKRKQHLTAPHIHRILMKLPKGGDDKMILRNKCSTTPLKDPSPLNPSIHCKKIILPESLWATVPHDSRSVCCRHVLRTHKCTFIFIYLFCAAQPLVKNSCVLTCVCCW